MQNRRQYFLVTALLMLTFLLTGCGAAVVGGAAYGGHKGATDNRSFGTMIDDSILSSSIKSKMIADEFIQARHIDVDVIQGVVYLIGVVKSESQKRMAADLVRGFEGVRRLENQLMVARTSASQMLDDTILTSKIKAELLKTPDIRSTNIDVDTNNNVVTLTGIVSSHKEKSAAIHTTRRVAGNRQIVDNLTVDN